MTNVKFANSMKRTQGELIPETTTLKDAIENCEIYDGDLTGWQINGRPVYDYTMTFDDFGLAGKTAFVSKIIKADCANSR